MRTPVFELHILPMFRALDRAHMQKFRGIDFDLWDYEFVSSNADRIIRNLDSMPTTDTGGPWPQEWVQLFERWTKTGYKRLSLGKAEYRLNRIKTVVELVADGTFPTSGYQGWLQLEAANGPSRSYVLYLEAPDEPGSAPGDSFTVAEQHEIDSEGGKVTVRDATGMTELAIPPLT